MRRVVATLVLAVGLAGARAGETPLRLFHLSGAAVDRGEASQAVTWGVPLPRGAAASVRELQVMDAAGKPVPCQFDVTATWDDGKSPQWVLLSFTADPRQPGYRLRYGAPPAAPAVATPGLKVDRQGDGYSVDTGVARFVITPTQPAGGLYLWRRATSTRAATRRRRRNSGSPDWAPRASRSGPRAGTATPPGKTCASTSCG